MEVSRDLISIKLLYFLYYGGLASFIPYKSIYQKQLGMSSAQNGVIQAIMQLVSFFSPPIAGIITDKTKAYKAMLATLMFFSIVFTIPFYFVSPVEFEPPEVIERCCEIESNLFCPSNSTSLNLTNCGKNENITLSDPEFINTCPNATIDCVPIENKEVYGTTFVILVVLTALMSFFLAPVTPLVDSSAMDTLGVGKVKDFGVQRLWGAVGFGFSGLVGGYLTDLISPIEIYGEFTKNYSLSVSSAAVFWMLAIIVMLVSVNITAPKAKGILRGVGKLLTKPEIVGFLLVVLVCGFSTGVQYSYLFWYLMELEGYQQYILGLSLLITCLSEIPMFWFSGWICKKFGYVNVLCIGLIAVSIRFFTYTVLTEAWQVLLIEWLHGISFALPMAAICSYATVMAPKDAVATLISISQTVYWGIGNMLGALLGGLVYNSFGGKITFYITCITCSTSAAVYWVMFGRFGLIKTLSYKDAGGETNKKVEDNTEVAVTSEEEPLHDAANGYA